MRGLPGVPFTPGYLQMKSCHSSERDTALAHVYCSSTGVKLQLGRLAPTCCCWLSSEKSTRLFRGRQGYWENRECIQPEDDFPFHCLVDTNVLRHRIVVFVLSGYDYIQTGEDWYPRHFHSSTELGCSEHGNDIAAAQLSSRLEYNNPCHVIRLEADNKYGEIKY